MKDYEWRGPRGEFACQLGHFPLVFMRFSGTFDLDHLEQYNLWLAEHVDWLEREDLRAAWIGDVSRIELPSVEVRRALAERWRVNLERYRGRVLTEYIVVDNSLLRGMFTLLRLVNPRLHAETFATFDAAQRRARAVLIDAGVACPAPTREQLEQLFSPKSL
ncbi:hypothetical protein ACNOYE_38260 [Nannocystaceae bacterium ST9]